MHSRRQRNDFYNHRESSSTNRGEHQVLPDVEVPQIKEPMPVCSICGEPINAIVEAIREADGSYSHFDCVINKIKEQYKVTEPDTVSYVGHGCFAVVGKNEEGSMVFKERIQYESSETFSEMKKFVEASKQ